MTCLNSLASRVVRRSGTSPVSSSWKGLGAGSEMRWIGAASGLRRAFLAFSAFAFASRSAFAAAALALNFTHVQRSVIGVNETTTVLLTLLFFLALLRYVDRPSLRSHLLCGLLLGLAIGGVSALLAIVPVAREGSDTGSLTHVLLLVLLLVVNGVLWILLALRSVDAVRPLRALRGE